ncbi:ribosomal protein S7 domain-containing protein [Stachybotrys elegans]|uniref:Small ribosomal subunit protein uS7m n=1 Tax=Stachybotrys elegans TaxID=80388 RepID=A0A8K0STR7_9HYPO|nr:ribosomal protein S7 domain-containing protein [Stachybotrys elegans]
MSPRLRIWGACRALAIRSRPALEQFSARPTRRFLTDDAHKSSAQSIPPTASAGPSGAAPKAGDAVSSTEPTAQGQATADTHIQALDDETLEKIFFGGRTVTSKGESGLTSAQESALYQEGTIPSAAEAEEMVANGAIEDVVGMMDPASGRLQNSVETPGHKFPLPQKPYPEGFHLKKRYHPVLDQVTRLLMRDGKLAAAQRNMAMTLNFLRTSPAPIYSPKFPLLPGTPPAAHLPLNPILYLTVAVDSVAPLLKIRHLAKLAGGGRALEVPTPLGLRQRRRVAFQWILDVVNKKPSMGSGRKQLPHRLAEEIIAVVEGRSSVWEKRKAVHKQGTSARANIATAQRGGKKAKFRKL